MGSYTVWPPLVHFFYIPLMQCSQESSMLSWCSSGWTIVLCANLLCTISCLRGMTYSYICNSFISSGCLIAQASVCSPILKKSWDTGQPCLILILMGLDFKALSNVPVTSFAVYTFMHFQMHFCCWLRVSFFFFCQFCRLTQSFTHASQLLHYWATTSAFIAFWCGNIFSSLSVFLSLISIFVT